MKRFANAQIAAKTNASQKSNKAKTSQDEITLGETTFVMQPHGVRHGGSRGTKMKYQLTCCSDITVMFQAREKALGTQPNMTVTVGSLSLMRYGLPFIWKKINHWINSMGAVLVEDKISRIDACVDLANVLVSEFVTPFSNNHYVSLTQSGTVYGSVEHQKHFSRRVTTGFSCGKSPLRFTLYDKLREVFEKGHKDKYSVLVRNRWQMVPQSAVRPEFQIRRERLKKFGVSSTSDWFEKRAAVCHSLTHKFFRLTDGPVDRRHSQRAPTHPLWVKVQESFALWCGDKITTDLSAIPPQPVPPSHKVRSALNGLVDYLATVGKIPLSELQAYREIKAALQDQIGQRDICEMVRRKRLEMGLQGLNS